MKTALVEKTLRAIAPLLIGAVGGWVATVYPQGFTAFCAQALL